MVRTPGAEKGDGPLVLSFFSHFLFCFLEVISFYPLIWREREREREKFFVSLYRMNIKRKKDN